MAKANNNAEMQALKGLLTKVDADDRMILEEFISVYQEEEDPDELEEYIDLLLGVADNIDENEQEIIYDLIRKIQN